MVVPPVTQQAERSSVDRIKAQPSSVNRAGNVEEYAETKPCNDYNGILVNVSSTASAIHCVTHSRLRSTLLISRLIAIDTILLKHRIRSLTPIVRTRYRVSNSASCTIPRRLTRWVARTATTMGPVRVLSSRTTQTEAFRTLIRWIARLVTRPGPTTAWVATSPRSTMPIRLNTSSATSQVSESYSRRMRLTSSISHPS